MSNDEEIIVSFDSAAQAIMAEQALIQQNFDVRVMPTPAAIKTGCGFCLRFLPADMQKIAASLAELGLPINEVYRREKQSGSYKKSTFNSNLINAPH